MVENMFFLDSEHLEMVGIAPSPSRTHTHTRTHTHFQIFILMGGENKFQWGNPPNSKQYPCISKDFFDLYIRFFTSLLSDLVQSWWNTIRVCLVSML